MFGDSACSMIAVSAGLLAFGGWHHRVSNSKVWRRVFENSGDHHSLSVVIWKRWLRCAPNVISEACVQLEKLDLEDCALVTDSTLAQLAVHCPRLNTLVLSHCDQVTDEGIARLAEGLCGSDQLQTLAMDNCPLLTDAALEHLGSNCRKLKQLDLYDCQLITKQGINSLEVSHFLFSFLQF
ncbi:unnamed protein product [Trichobilharzia regenti]|nr:unnamed protein product [Trichobilharzia regenti]